MSKVKCTHRLQRLGQCWPKLLDADCRRWYKDLIRFDAGPIIFRVMSNLRRAIAVYLDCPYTSLCEMADTQAPYTRINSMISFLFHVSCNGTGTAYLFACLDFKPQSKLCKWLIKFLESACQLFHSHGLCRIPSPPSLLASSITFPSIDALKRT